MTINSLKYPNKMSGGIALIKYDYLLNVEKPTNAEVVEVKPVLPSLMSIDSRNTNHDEVVAAKRPRGMDHNRKSKMMKARNEARPKIIRLCKSIVVPGSKCKFGEKCDCMHSLEDYWKVRPADIGNECINFNLQGKCQYGAGCRFAGAHTTEDLKQTTKDPQEEYKPLMNNHFQHIQQAIRKKQYDFSASDHAVEIKEDIFEPDFEDFKLNEEAWSGAMAREKLKFDMRSIRGKRYLAPLTTVGNLPFRRLCVDFGAEITCGEMAIATNLLQGHPNEWSLVKRHPSEKIFGLQLAGGYADSLSRATQIIADNFQVDFIDLNLGCPLDAINEKGAGCTLANRSNRLMESVYSMGNSAKQIPITVKMRYGIREGQRNAHFIIKKLSHTGLANLISLHPRSKEQRYSKAAEWDYVPQCVEAVGGKCPLWVGGDVLSYEDYYKKLEQYSIDGVLIGRGALIKPWIFTEIEERRHWDITATERLDIVKKYVNYGLENWGSDHSGVENTRRFLLEWLSFQCRYIPVGLLEILPQKINQRPPAYRGRNELETLLASAASSDWIKITEMFLGKVPEGFLFAPKHNANAY